MGIPTWLLIVPILFVLVVIHEFGHFLAARFFGVKVEEFGVGLPPRIVGREWRGTLWSLNWIPLGGFARMKDENEAGEAPDSFQSKSAGARAVILLGGIVFNLIFAGLLFAFIQATYGVPTGVGRLFIGSVTADTPATMAGWRTGDEILRVAEMPVRTQAELSDALKRANGQSVAVTIRRGNATLNTSVAPRLDPPKGQGATGITLNVTENYERVPIWQAIPGGFRQLGQGSLAIVNFLGQLVTGRAPGGVAGNVSGPIGIAQTIGEAVQVSPMPAWVTIANITAVISINLAIFNLLPIPALDGGRLVFVLIEILRRGRRVPPEREGMVHVIGMAVLLSLFVLVAFMDIQRIFDGRSILPK